MAFPEETSWPAAAREGFDDPLRVAWTGAQRGRGKAASRESPVESDSFSSVSAPAAVETHARRPRGAGGAEGAPLGLRRSPPTPPPPSHALPALRPAGSQGRPSLPGGAGVPGHLGRSCCGASGLDTQTSGWGRLPRGPASSPHHGTPSPQRPCPISGALPCFPGEPLSLRTLHHCWNTHVWGSPAPRTCSHDSHRMGNTPLEIAFANKAPQAELWAVEFAQGGGPGKRAVCRRSSRLPPRSGVRWGRAPGGSTALWFG